MKRVLAYTTYDEPNFMNIQVFPSEKAALKFTDEIVSLFKFELAKVDKNGDYQLNGMEIKGKVLKNYNHYKKDNREFTLWEKIKFVLFNKFEVKK